MNVGPKKEMQSTISASRRIWWSWNNWSYYSVNWYRIVSVIIMFKSAIVILSHNVIKSLNFICESRCWM